MDKNYLSSIALNEYSDLTLAERQKIFDSLHMHYAMMLAKTLKVGMRYSGCTRLNNLDMEFTGEDWN